MITDCLRYLSLIVLGCILGVWFCNYEYFKLDPSIELGDLFGFALTSFIGLFIANNIQKYLNANRKEKDYIIDVLRKLMSDFLELNSYTELNEYPFDKTKRLIRSLNRKIIQTERLINISSHNNIINLNDLHTSLKSVRRLILGVSPVAGNIVLSSRQKNTAETKLDSIEQEIYRLILKINNS
ncbi:hypothetical protein [Pedobacter sp. UYP1]|uniref:hypothetical protein n=1 Tax=Pedobacter sp. UYP1 TaxID=1756396 RepID=UPI00339B18A0